MRRRFPAQLLLQHLMKNLERARPINESGSRAGNYWRSYCDPVAITRIVIVQIKHRIEPAREIEQLPNRYPRFARIVAPRRDSGCHVLIEVQQTILGGGKRGQPPKGFRAAVNLSRLPRGLFE